jgi:WD40 repeat protein
MLIEVSEWQHETANFFTRPDDGHSCVNVTPTEPQLAIPFCTASCNSEFPVFASRGPTWLTVVANSLVAIGDEEGGVRLLDTDRDSKTPFSQAYLSFRPHNNAILNLSFSPDDLLLATASGDQTSRVIDMPTQTAIFGMAGHTSSVKQVCFQPGSSSVVVTSSRDGSVLMWDLRCKGYDGPALKLKILLDAHEDDSSTRDRQRRVPFARPVNAIHDAHAPTSRQASSAALKPALKTALTRDAPSRTEPQSRRGDVSITSLAFLPPGREHLLLTGSEANASVKLWDLRTTQTSRRGRAIPLSSTRQPDSHNSHRHFGLTSMALSGDGARLYTACRDNTVYTYSTSHLILGHAPELSLSTSRPRRRGSDEKEGLGPIYGFRHPQYHATTFYVKSALRPAAANHSELLAVGSSDGCAVLFPTDERYLGRNVPAKPSLPSLRSDRSRPSLSRTDSGTNLFTRLNDTIPIYQEGTALVRGHNREVTDMTWTPNGKLVTVGDDYTARCWREGPDARDLRMGGETEGRRWGCGWAEVEGAWDDDE